MTKLNAQWIVGFVDGEGCFQASVINNKTIKNKVQIQIEFVVTQHRRDVTLLYALKSYFKCGIVSKIKENLYCFRVRKLDHLLHNVNPFFEKHCLKTKKQVEFVRFRELCLHLNNKTHLTDSGFQLCLKLAKSLRYCDNLSHLHPLPLG